MGIASCVSYAGDEITRLAYGDYPCEILLAVNVVMVQLVHLSMWNQLRAKKKNTISCDVLEKMSLPLYHLDYTFNFCRLYTVKN